MKKRTLLLSLFLMRSRHFNYLSEKSVRDFCSFCGSSLSLAKERPFSPVKVKDVG